MGRSGRETESFDHPQLSQNDPYLDQPPQPATVYACAQTTAGGRHCQAQGARQDTHMHALTKPSRLILPQEHRRHSAGLETRHSEGGGHWRHSFVVYHTDA